MAASPGKPNHENTGLTNVEIQVSMPVYLSTKMANDTVAVILKIHHIVLNARGVAVFSILLNFTSTLPSTNDTHKIFYLQRSATNQATINIGIGKQFLGI